MRLIDYLCVANVLRPIDMTEFNEMQTLKRRLFAMRNGAIADNMRRQGADYRIIFGVNLPQLVEIASETPHTADLAERLWQNRTTRESMLIAPMLYPREQYSVETARRWVSEVPTAEVADILCHRLLRHMNFAYALAEEFVTSESDMERYVAFRLFFNLLPARIDDMKGYADKELAQNCQLTKMLCRMLLDEIEFIQEVD